MESKACFGKQAKIEKRCVMKSYADVLIGLFQKGLGNKKAEHLVISDKTFGNMPMTGLEPAPCNQE